MTSENVQTSQSADLKVKNYVKAHLSQNQENTVGTLLGKDAPKVGEFFQGKVANARKKANEVLEGFDHIKRGHDLENYITQLQAQTTKLIHELEQVTDLSIGIVREVSLPEDGMAFVGSDIESKVPITIRDARLQWRYRESGDVPKKAEDVLETTSTIAAGMLRGVLQIIKDCDDGDLKHRAVGEAVGLFKKYKLKIEKDKPRSQSERNTILKRMNKEFKDVLVTNDLKINGKQLSGFPEDSLRIAMGHVRDLANLTDDRQSSIFTLTNIGPFKTHISASTPFKPLSQELEAFYQGDELKMLTAGMNPILAHSFTQGGFVGKIMDGKHMIPSQLHFPGLRNAWEERSFVMDNAGNVEAERVTSRSATPADKNGRGNRAVSEANIRHMKQLSGSTDLLDVTVLNSGVRSALGGEKPIVTSVQQAVRDCSDGAGFKVSVCSISKHDSNKGTHFVQISEGAREAAKTISSGNTAQKRRQFITCKSGKDRTNAAVTLSAMDSMEDVKGIDVELAQARIAIAGHGSALSAASGATIGINGTKSANALNGVKEKDCILVKFKEELVSDIADANHVEFASKNQPYLSVLRSASAIAQGVESVIQRMDSVTDGLPMTPNVQRKDSPSKIRRSDSQA